MLRTYRFWLIGLCCVLLGAARAQDLQPSESDKAAPPAQAQTQAQTQSEEQPQEQPEDTKDPADTEDIDFDSGSKHIHFHGHHKHGNGDDVVSVGHGAELEAGHHASDVVAVLGSAISAGDVEDSVVAVLGNARVTGPVGDSTVAVLGSLYVNSEVKRDVVAVMGNVELGPEAKIRGDVVVIGGVLTRDPKAVIEGHVQTVLGGDLQNFGWLRPWIEKCLLYGRPLAFASGLGWAWTLALGLLALYVFIALLFTSAVDRCIHTLEEHPGQSVITAIVTMLLAPVTIVLLCITVLGILAVPFLGLALLGALIFGKVVVLAAIGKRCTPFMATSPQLHTIIGVLVGGLIVLVLYTVPVVGFILSKLIEVLGFGVVVYTVLIATKTARAARAAGGSPGAGGPGAPGAGPHGMGPAPHGGAMPPGAGGATGAAGSHAFGAAGAAGAGAAGAAGAGAASGGGGPFAGPFDQASGGAAAGGSAAGGAGADAAAGAHSGGSGMEGPHMGGATEGPGPYTAGPNAAGPNGGPPNTGIPINPTPYLHQLSLPRAGFWIRMGALLLDVIVIGIVSHILDDHNFDWNLILLAGYGAVMWKLKGSTIGGIICGLQIVRVDGRAIDWPTAIVRALSCFLSIAAVGLGFLWIAIDEHSQAWHDKIAGTVVVRAPKGASLL